MAVRTVLFFLHGQLILEEIKDEESQMEEHI